MIHHLSYPEGCSVNDNIHPDQTRVRYSCVQDAIELVTSHEEQVYMAKTDVEKAFRLLPIHPDDQHLFVFHWNSLFYVDLALPMGCAASCNLFEVFSTALNWIATVKLGIPMIHYLDDFFMTALSERVGQRHLKSFLDMCADIGVPMAEDKTCGPDTTMTFLGVEIDSVRKEARLPKDKLDKCRQEIRFLLGCKKATLKQVQSVIGLLNFACQVVLPGRPFLRRLINATIGVKAPHHFVKLNKGIKRDLEVWLNFLDSFNGRCFLADSLLSSATQWQLFTDASATVGYGAVLGNQWFQGIWSDWWKQQNITLLELYPIVVALETWEQLCRGKSLVLNTDNEALVSVLNNQTSKEPLVMILVRRLVLHCLHNRILITAKHVAGVNNGAADALSRFQMQRFREILPGAAPHPCGISPLPPLLQDLGT
jgi:hypothetical protein